MKKYILCLFLLLSLSAGNHVRAQYSDYYYHIVGDTVEWQANNGYYSWWEFKTFFEQNLTMQKYENLYLGGEFDSLIVLQRYYTPTPLKIIGIAGNGTRKRRISGSNYNVPDTNCFQEYYYVYDADPSGLTLKAEQPWSPFSPGRTLHLKLHKIWSMGWGEGPTDDSCCWYNPVDLYIPFQEYYFDSAIYVTDSFYVGCSTFGNRPSTMTGIPSSDSVRTFYLRFGASFDDYVCNPELQTAGGRCNIRGIHWKYRHRCTLESFQYHNLPFDQVPWLDVENNYEHPLLIYPIVEVDTTMPPVDACPPVSNVQVFVSGTTATVTWDDFPNYSTVELNYGPCPAPPSQCETVDVTGRTLYTLTGLNPSYCYKVRLRAECDTSKTETPWSAPVTIYTGQDTTHTGGDDSVGVRPTALSQFTFLVPNPAKDEVVVSSGFNLQEIDIWTVDGVWVHHQSAAGHRVTVPIDFLRPGTYIVAIRTHNGTTHKKLVISR